MTSTWSPPIFLAWQKESWLGSGLIWRHLGPLLLVKFLGLPAGRIGSLLWGLGGISWWVALVLLLLSLVVGFCRIGGLCLILLFVRVSINLGGLRRFLLPVQHTPLWSASWLPVLDKSRVSKAAEVQRVWDIYDDRVTVYVSR